jgi:hypothetical protein
MSPRDPFLFEHPPAVPPERTSALTPRCLFLRSLIFAAVVALGGVTWVVVVSPLVGRSDAAAAAFLAAAVLYLAWIATSLRRAVLAAVGGGSLALLVLLFGASPSEVAAGGAVLLAVLRSAFLYRSPPLRALAVEVALLTAGALVGQWLYAPSPLGAGLALWGFFLVQSLFFLMWHRGEDEAGALDRFDEARLRALELMEEAR